MKKIYFGAAIHRIKFAEVNTIPLVDRALELYESCKANLPLGSLESTLPGGSKSTVNMMFFKQQIARFNETKKTKHLQGFEGLDEFHDLQYKFKNAATNYLQEINDLDEGNESLDLITTVEKAPIFVWASIHTGGSVHPPHVHSDAMCTGTFYAQRPPTAAPIVFDDPRGTSPFDVLVSIESNLRYGDGVASKPEATPPFNNPVFVYPEEKECVLFPPWLVHQVPGTTPEDVVRVSFSFNVLGKWAWSA
jgi:uncharacterized protein (TIGR02466 family)